MTLNLIRIAVSKYVTPTAIELLKKVLPKSTTVTQEFSLREFALRLNKRELSKSLVRKLIVKFNYSDNKGRLYSAAIAASKQFYSKIKILGILSPIVIGTYGIGIAYSKDQSISYLKNGILDIPSNCSKNEMKNIIDKMIKLRDLKSLKELISLNNKDTFFTEVNFKEIEYQICSTLILNRDLEFIEEIFPLLSSPESHHIYDNSLACRDIELWKVLFKVGIDVRQKIKHSSQNDIILECIRKDQIEDLNFFREVGYDINGTYLYNIKGFPGKESFDVNYFVKITPAYLAVALDRPDVLEQLIAWGAKCSTNNTFATTDDISFVDHDYDSALSYAIKIDNEECFNIIVNSELTDLNTRGRFNETPLMTAIRYKRFNMASALIDLGADITITDILNQSPLQQSVSLDFCTTKKLLIPLVKRYRITTTETGYVGHGMDELWHSAIKCESEEEMIKIMELLKMHIPKFIEHLDNRGFTPLRRAVYSENPLAVKALLDFGASKSTLVYKKNEYFTKVSIHEYAQSLLDDLTRRSKKTKQTPEEQAIDNLKVKKMEQIIKMLNEYPYKLT